MKTAFLFAAALIFVTKGAAQSALVQGDLGKRLDTYLTRLSEYGFSGAALVAKDGEILVKKGYGQADRDTGRKVSAQTVFTTGSITKQFTGAAILKLEMAGSLSVDDPISNYLDDIPDDKKNITIHHLLTHTAGFPGAIGDDFKGLSREDFIRLALQVELQSEPGSRYRYSNVGYSLAAILVELVSGQTYEKFLRQHLFLPAGMQRTGYNLPDFKANEVAVGYRGDERWGTFLERESYTAGPSWHLKGNGGIQSTVEDMYLWHLALESDTILSDLAKEKYITRHVDEGFGDSWYGYGWALFDTPHGTRLVAHNGGNMVFSADFKRFIDDNVVVYVTSSSSEFFIDPISKALSDMVFNLPVKMPPATFPMDDTKLDSLTGLYRLSDQDRIQVEVARGALKITAMGEVAQNLLAGGSATRNPETAMLTDRSTKIANQWIAGDANGIHKAMGASIPLAQLEGQLGEFRKMREQAYGKMTSVSVLQVQTGPELTRVVLAFAHERRTAYAAFGWEAGELASIEPLRKAPASSAVLYPISTNRFTSFSLRNPDRLQIRFVPGDDETIHLVFSTPEGEVRLKP